MTNRSAGTTFVEFQDVKVPVSNLIGPMGGGFKVLVYNFNSERIGSISGAVFSARVAYTEALKWAHKRRTFGKLLIEHPVIRAKLANMARQIEASQAWIELLVCGCPRPAHSSPKSAACSSLKKT